MKISEIIKKVEDLDIDPTLKIDLLDYLNFYDAKKVQINLKEFIKYCEFKKRIEELENKVAIYGLTCFTLFITCILLIYYNIIY